MWQKSWRDIGKMHFSVLKMSDHLAAVVNLSKKLKGKCSPVCKLNDDNWLKPIFHFFGRNGTLKKKLIIIISYCWPLEEAELKSILYNHYWLTRCKTPSYWLTDWLTELKSPWYNHTGWLGIKHQVTYLPTYWTEKCFFLVENITDHLLVLLIFPGSWPERCVLLLWRGLMI